MEVQQDALTYKPKEDGERGTGAPRYGPGETEALEAERLRMARAPDKARDTASFCPNSPVTAGNHPSSPSVKGVAGGSRSQPWSRCPALPWAWTCRTRWTTTCGWSWRWRRSPSPSTMTPGLRKLKLWEWLLT